VLKTDEFQCERTHRGKAIYSNGGGWRDALGPYECNVSKSRGEISLGGLMTDGGAARKIGCQEMRSFLRGE